VGVAGEDCGRSCLESKIDCCAVRVLYEYCKIHQQNPGKPVKNDSHQEIVYLRL
jgi:hypothetical protein